MTEKYELLCNYCRYWNRLKDNVGECRRRPPAFGDLPDHPRWPQSHASEWCGEFEDLHK